MNAPHDDRKRTAWDDPVVVALLQFLVPCSGYLALEAYGRFATGILLLAASLFVSHPAVMALMPLLVIDAYLLARRRKPPYFGARRRPRAFAFGAFVVAAWIALAFVVALRPAWLVPSDQGCRTVYALASRARSACLRQRRPPSAAPVAARKITMSYDRECELYLSDKKLAPVGDAADPRKAFRDVCYLMRAVMSDDAGYCASLSDGVHRCFTFLAATDGKTSVCSGDGGDVRAECEAAVTDPAAKKKIFDEVGQMNCAQLGFKGDVLARCRSAFGGYFDQVNAAYKRSQAAQ